MNVFALFLTVFIGSLASGQAQAPLTIRTDPGIVLLGLTKSLTVDCLMPSLLTTGYHRLVSMVLSKRNPTTKALEELISVSAFSPDVINVVHPSTGTPSAYLNETGVSSIGLEWPYPIEKDTGFFECEATVLDSAHHSIKLKVNRNVFYSIPNLNALVDYFRIIEIELESLKDRISSATESMFQVSNVTDGSRYYLSRFPYATVDRAETACNMVNGHLAEITNQTELDSVLQYLRSDDVQLPSSQFVLIGLSDEATEGRWVYRASGETASFKPWASGEPNGKTAYNCAVLKVDTARYYDYQCASTADAYFLCENE